MAWLVVFSIRLLLAVLFMALAIGGVLELRKGIRDGRFARHHGFRQLTDSDLDYAYRDKDFVGFSVGVLAYCGSIVICAVAVYALLSR